MQALRALTLTSALILSACGGGSPGDDVAAERAANAQKAAADGGPLAELALPPDTAAAHERVDRRLRGASGEVEVWVTLDQPSVGKRRRELAPESALRERDPALRSQLAGHRQALRGRQNEMAASLQSVGAREIARVQVAHNALAVRVDARELRRIAQLPGVLAVRPVVNYELMLGETVPYVGGTAVQARGFDGSGVKVAVLDSGIDYTHRNLGGAGTPAAYAAAYGAGPGDPLQTTLDGLFPTAKVVAGFDFVGEVWPNGALTEDPDPIDLEGHGTHVADIIAGRSADGTHRGVAPGASLVAVKVCSAVGSSCSGVALLKGMDYAIDPNGDGDFSDAVDVINLSLGSGYGQDEDDLSQAAAEAVALGVTVVASAGNSGDRPYITGSPASALGVISVAQTQVPSATAVPLVINAPAAIAGSYANTATLDFAPLTGAVSGEVVFGGTACVDAPLAGVAGKIALIDRGVCSISLKVDSAARGGAVGVLIGLVAPGDAVSFSFGGGTQFVPSLVITQATSNLIKANLAAPVTATISPANGISLIGSMASSSSRGPDVSRSSIKPEIGAPGASLSAEVGTGSGETAFGGTSGAAPMVAGAAALLVQAHPTLKPEQIKALLMNSANTNVFTNPATAPGALAPITRIGAGELRVDRALGRTALARNRDAASASLPFGFVEVARRERLEQELIVENLSNRPQRFSVDTTFRYADDAASGAVRIDAPRSITVPARRSAKLKVQLHIDADRLPSWTLNGGSNGGNGALLQGVEFDGYLTLASGNETLSVPWQVLVRKSADIDLPGRNPTVRIGQDLRLGNQGAEVGAFEVFALTGRNPRTDIPAPQPGDSYAVIDLRAVGVRAVGTTLQFAISTFGKRAHPLYPGGFEVDIDVDNDGTIDAYVYQAELTGFAATGQSVVNWVNLRTGLAGASFFTDADLQSGNVILSVPMAAIGVDPAQPMTFDVLAYDNYFTGAVTDALTGMRFTPATPRYAVAGDTSPVPVRGQRRLEARAVANGETASPSQTGFLLLYRRNAGPEVDVVTVR